MEGIHLITNGRLTTEELKKIPFLQSELDYIHIREKNKTAQELQSILSFLKENEVSKKKLIINDRVDLAVLNHCHGVQLAYHSLSVKAVKNSFPKLTIGKSVHSLEEAIQAEKEGATFLIFGHVFASLSKIGLPSRGLNSLQKITQSVSLPTIAIGGITPPQRTRAVLEAGASGIAIMSGIWNAKDSSEALKSYRDVFNDWKEGGVV
ncbi:thiamin-phosphate pyrophosphorylase [Gracilibacillus boraciitolerans JCM 21714]|uniref:Thiamin-phosphate pyrophosphorylase n=1 Tax=Gracilibacillus boraciitolerans JCM 21714 TaxID=1298598 RepID=W4VKJ5_9BACI|nr:thiazole tautomerase TenI [Gracilibacillus boraciitolerans]GAE93671.1 thiamin-phosphate pyrophosphorylase [Gracilibacillus boraciitolerans JCM 21714]